MVQRLFLVLAREPKRTRLLPTVLDLRPGILPLSNRNQPPLYCARTVERPPASYFRTYTNIDSFFVPGPISQPLAGFKANRIAAGKKDDLTFSAGLETNNPAKGIQSSFIKTSPFHNNKQTHIYLDGVCSTTNRFRRMDWIKSLDLDIQARIPFSLFQKEKRTARFTCVSLWYTGQSIRSAGPFPGLKKSVPPKKGVSSRLPASQIRMQELELFYPQHPSKRDAFTGAFHQKEAFLQSAPLPRFCGSRRNKHKVVSWLLY
ncbi:hypothetical protein PIB30_038804 [Stylosanthes scabra]|uniref:Ribosomal protein L5 n=1 Tax=Stylosanthes scabra TaxID=79078 RepID=A0ABU6QEN3_9FABA|nr:hypothetical protein [Stylosanthes scabra]